MRRLACLLGCTALAATVGPGPAPAAPRALLDAPRAEDVALAGSEVLVSIPTSRGGARLVAVPAGGGPARTALSVRPPGGGAWTAATRLASSSQLTAVLVGFTDPEGRTTDWRIYAGPPAGPLGLVHRVRLRRQRGRFWIPIEIDVHGDALLVQEAGLPLRDGEAADILIRLTVHASGTSWRPLAASRSGMPVAMAGDRLAYVGGGWRRVRIVDWRSGRLTGMIGLPNFSDDLTERHLDLGEDARAVVELDGELFAGAPGERARPLPGSEGAPELTAPRMAGGLVAALAAGPLDTRRPVVIDPTAATRRAVGPPSTALTALAAAPPSTATGATAAWLANGCVLAADLGVGAGGPPPPAAPPPFAAPPPGACPRAEVVLEEHDQVPRGRTLRVRVTCVSAPPSGCRGRVVLGFAGRAGHGAFHARAGRRQLVDVRLTRRGLAAIRRQRRFAGAALLRLDARMADGRVSREAGTRWVLVVRRR